jgi:hypothetical protein
MGYPTWSDDAYLNISSTYKTKTVDEIFLSNKTKEIHSDLNPNGLVIRESRDSINHPHSLAIAVFLDVTGSMGDIPETLIREKLGALMNTIINHNVADPQILFGAIGDHLFDNCPLQVGQFECDAESLNSCLSKVYIEGNGGGNQCESYMLSWITAARHTSIDCFEKRKEKGFLFTIGDEKNAPNVSANKLKEIFGYAQASDIDAKDIYEEVSRMYNVYHIHCNDGSYSTTKDSGKQVQESWKLILGERFIVLDDSNLVAETIASVVGIMHGYELDKITSNMSIGDSNIIEKALVNITTNSITSLDSGVINL